MFCFFFQKNWGVIKKLCHWTTCFTHFEIFVLTGYVSGNPCIILRVLPSCLPNLFFICDIQKLWWIWLSQILSESGSNFMKVAFVLVTLCKYKERQNVVKLQCRRVEFFHERYYLSLRQIYDSNREFPQPKISRRKTQFLPHTNAHKSLRAVRLILGSLLCRKSNMKYKQ